MIVCIQGMTSIATQVSLIGLGSLRFINRENIPYSLIFGHCLYKFSFFLRLK